MCRNCRNETDKLVALGDSDPTMPFLQVSGRFQSPSKKFWTVVKPGTNVYYFLSEVLLNIHLNILSSSST